MTSEPTFNELSALDGEFLPERTVLSAAGSATNPVCNVKALNGLYKIPVVGKDVGETVYDGLQCG